MNSLSRLPWFRATTLPAAAHISSQCAQILARLDAEGLGLRETDTFVRMPASPTYFRGVSGHNEESAFGGSLSGGASWRHGGPVQQTAGQQAEDTTTTTKEETARASFLHYDRTPHSDIGTSEAVEDAVFDGAVVYDWRVPSPALALGLSDHALYIVGLLSCRKRLDAVGWRSLCREAKVDGERKGLDARLGKATVDGQRVSRATLLLGSLARGGDKCPRDAREGELITRGIVERYPVYCPRTGMAQQYRLKDQSWLAGPHEAVDITLCPSGRAGGAKGAKGAQGGEEVPHHLSTTYRGHTLDVSSAVREVMRAAFAAAAAEHRRLLKLPKRTKVQTQRMADLAARTLPAVLNYSDFSAMQDAVEALGELRNPKLIGKRGRPPKGMCKDLRERFAHALGHIRANYVASEPAKHQLSRAHGRLFSPFVGLWKDLRSHVRLNGERLVELDIKNAQPLLIANRMVSEGHSDVPDVRLFADLCQSGRIYEYAHNLLNGHDLDAEVEEADRDRMKVGFYSGWMFCDLEDMNRSDFGRAMTIAFPSVDAWVRAQKEGDYAAFACACQRYEAGLMVDRLAVVFEREGLDVLTCHDASYVRESQAAASRLLLVSEVLASLPVRPIVVAKLV